MRDLLFRYTIVIHHKLPWIGKVITVLYNNFIYLLNNITANKKECLKNIEDGKRLLDKYTKDDKYYYVLINAGIGDSVIVASYAYYLKKKYKKDIAFIVLPSHVSIISGYDYIKKIIPCNKEDFDKIFLYIVNEDKYETNTYKYAFFKTKVSKNGVRNWATANTPGDFTLSEKYKKYVFNIDNNTKMYKIKIDTNEKKIKNIIKENKIKENPILLIPYAYTATNLNIKFWEELAQSLIELGYNVYTNIGNPKKEQVINGTYGINLPMNTMLEICNRFSYIISNRCGFGEYLALNNPKMILIDEWEKYSSGWDDANIYSSKKTVRYVYRNSKSNKKIIEDIINIIDNKK